MDFSSFQTNVQTLLANFREDGANYLTYLAGHPTHGDEAMVRQKIIEPLLAALGYNLAVEVHPEARVGSGSADIYVEATGPDPADPRNTLAIPAMVWELKRTGITDLSPYEDQLTPYVLLKGVRYGVLTNGHEIRLYERVGDSIHLAFDFSLKAFASGATAPPTDDEVMALAGFHDLLHHDSFLDVERQKREIVSPPYHPLRLAPTEPHNEDKLIGELKREISQLRRLVLLRFRAHRRRVDAFEAEDQTRREDAEVARAELLNWLVRFLENARLSEDTTSLETFLSDFASHWPTFDETELVAGALNACGVASHLNGANRHAFEIRAQRFYRAFTGHARWRLQQLSSLRPSRNLVENFDHWREEIGIMVEDPEAEFCLQTVYIFVTRLLLIRICEDKGILKEKISDGGYKDYVDFSQRFYDYLGHANRRLLSLAYEDTSYIYGHFFSRNIFDWHDWEEESIVRLFWVLNPYDFAEVGADLIGRIYEQYVDELERKRKGQFYTPAEVVNAVLDAAEYRGSDVVGKRLLDPGCGSGRFLVEAARRLIPELEAVYVRTATPEAPVDYEELVNERLRYSLYGLDVNRFACFLAEVNLVVQVLDLFKKSDKPFTILRFHVYPTNSLLREDEAAATPMALADLPADNGLAGERLVAELIKSRGRHPADPHLDFRSGFDYVVGNPPYVRADNPGVAALRRRVEDTGRYSSLYKKWDLFIPFIDLSLDMLRSPNPALGVEGGRHAFVVSDAYQTEEYARQSRARLLSETTIEHLVFAPGVYFFDEAAVFNLIYGVRQGAPPAGHKVQRRQVLDRPLSDPHNVRVLTPLAQDKWGEQIFRPEFEGNDGLDFSSCVPLGQICYINSGLELQSHEKFDPVVAGKRQKSFIKDDLLSETKDEMHPKPYVEGDDIGYLVLYRSRYLEWGTKRVPDQLRRARFPELFENTKIMMGETSGVYYDTGGEFVNNHSVRNFVPYHAFADPAVRRHVAGILARELTEDDVASLGLAPAQLERLSKTDLAERLIQVRAAVSPTYDLRYLAALLNCTWLRTYVMTFIRRGSRHRLYPDDLKQWPIAPADAGTQAQVGDLVQEIMDAKADIQSWRQAGHLVDAERGVRLHPVPYLKHWGIPTGDLLDASGFITAQVHGSPTGKVEEIGDRLIFRKQPLSYFESPHPHVRQYLRRYLETTLDTLRAVPPAALVKTIKIPKSAGAVGEFLKQLEAEELRVTLRWLDAAQREALIDEMAFDLYNVDDKMRQKLSGPLHTLKNVPDGTKYVSLLADAADSPLRRVAFPWRDGWAIRTAETLPNTVLLWACDGETVEATIWEIL